MLAPVDTEPHLQALEVTHTADAFAVEPPRATELGKPTSALDPDPNEFINHRASDRR